MLWIALCVVTSTILVFVVEHFVSPAVERILCGLKLFLLFLQTPRCGNKPSAEVLLLQVCLRDDACIFVRTVFFPEQGLMRLIFGVIVFGCWIRTMFAVCILIVLCHRGGAVIVSSRVDWTVISSCAVIVVFAMAGLRAVLLTLALGLLGGGILRSLFAIALFGCIHHVYVM